MIGQNVKVCISSKIPVGTQPSHPCPIVSTPHTMPNVDVPKLDLHVAHSSRCAGETQPQPVFSCMTPSSHSVTFQTHPSRCSGDIQPSYNLLYQPICTNTVYVDFPLICYVDSYRIVNCLNCFAQQNLDVIHLFGLRHITQGVTKHPSKNTGSLQNLHLQPLLQPPHLSSSTSSVFAHSHRHQ